MLAKVISSSTGVSTNGPSNKIHIYSLYTGRKVDLFFRCVEQKTGPQDLPGKEFEESQPAAGRCCADCAPSQFVDDLKLDMHALAP